MGLNGANSRLSLFNGKFQVAQISHLYFASNGASRERTSFDRTPTHQNLYAFSAVSVLKGIERDHLDRNFVVRGQNGDRFLYSVATLCDDSTDQIDYLFTVRKTQERRGCIDTLDDNRFLA